MMNEMMTADDDGRGGSADVVDRPRVREPVQHLPVRVWRRPLLGPPRRAETGTVAMHELGCDEPGAFWNVNEAVIIPLENEDSERWKMMILGRPGLEDGVLRLSPWWVKMMNFVFKTGNFVFKTGDFALKMPNFVGDDMRGIYGQAKAVRFNII